MSLDTEQVLSFWKQAVEQCDDRSMPFAVLRDEMEAILGEVEHFEEFRSGYSRNESWWLKRQEELTGQIAAMERLVMVHYLPMDCPVCGRRRLEYDRRANLVKCEKCGTENWESK